MSRVQSSNQTINNFYDAEKVTFAQRGFSFTSFKRQQLVQQDVLEESFSTLSLLEKSHGPEENTSTLFEERKNKEVMPKISNKNFLATSFNCEKPVKVKPYSLIANDMMMNILSGSSEALAGLSSPLVKEKLTRIVKFCNLNWWARKPRELD